MVNQKECLYCKEIIKFKHRNSFAAHCRNCKLRPGINKITEKIKQTRLSKRKDYEFNCKKCGKKFILNLTQHSYKKGTYRKHCSRSCANSHTQTEENNNNRRKTILNKIKSGEIIPHKGLKGTLHPNFKDCGCNRINKENKLETFDKFKGICQDCSKQLIKEKLNTWTAHHNNKHINKEEYNDDKDRILYCRSCHASLHRKLRENNIKFMSF